MSEETANCRQCGTRFTYERVTARRELCDACRAENKRASDKVASRKAYLEKVKPARQARAAKGTGHGRPG